MLKTAARSRCSIAVLLAGCLTVSCGESPTARNASDEVEASADTPEGANAADPAPSSGAGGGNDPASGNGTEPSTSPPAPPVTQPESSPAASSAIPAAYRGRWGETLAACSRQAEDRDGIMTVTSNELHFNELRAVATSVTVRSSDRVSVNAEVNEPGRDFTFFTDLVLEGGGERLVREEEGPRKRYVRCPR
ncbi:MAG TPA: hypothetical protein VGD10_02230 [Allosphingosinicella sp.]|uniref:hypothetical protein n=1 Tax=Allosphingosinicella sp. TaxID=2823234 RepID=UPI002ED8EA26